MTKDYHAYVVKVLVRTVAKTESEALDTVRAELASALNDKRTRTNGWYVEGVLK